MIRAHPRLVFPSCSRARSRATALGRTVWMCALASALGLAPGLATAEEPTRAAALFEEGRIALEHGKLTVACAKLAESQKLEPRVGTLLNLADCEEQRGSMLAASDHWVAARDLAQASGDGRLAEAKRRFQELEGKIPRLTIRLQADAPAAAAVSLARGNAAPQVVRELGRPQRVDPGTYRVVVSAPNHRDRAYELELLAGDSHALSVNVGESVGAAEDPNARDSTDTGGPTKWWALNTTGAVVGGAGLVSIVVGAVFGARAISKKNEAADQYCTEENLCSQQGLDLQTEAQSAASASTATIVIGSVLCAGGIVMMVIPPSSDEPASEAARASSVRPTGPSLGLELGPASMLLRGRW
jgi:hypothetical protein